MIFSNNHKNVFVIDDLPEVVKGALMSRYSRSNLGMREIYEQEFRDQTDKAEDFYERVLIGYGDDSIAELGGAHLACEKVSCLAADVLTGARVGLSPLERSSRYVFENDSDYFYLPTTLSGTRLLKDEYVRICRNLRELYQKAFDFVFQQEVASIKSDLTPALRRAIHAKACDMARGFMPASTLTNVGLFGNGRAYEYLLKKMHVSLLDEVRLLAESMFEELTKVIPSFVKRANSPYDMHLESQGNALGRLSNYLAPTHIEEPEMVKLLSVSSSDERMGLAMSVLPYTNNLSLEDICNSIDDETASDTSQRLLRNKTTRRDKLPRGFEYYTFLFELSTSYGAYRDLRRHRMMTQERNLLTVLEGYVLEPSVIQFKDEFEGMLGRIEYWSQDVGPFTAQYLVPKACKVRWYMQINLRELIYLIELRSAQQGHPEYRRVAQELYTQALDQLPWIKHLVNCDMNNYNRGREASESRTEEKLNAAGLSVNR